MSRTSVLGFMNGYSRLVKFGEKAPPGHQPTPRQAKTSKRLPGTSNTVPVQEGIPTIIVPWTTKTLIFAGS